MSNGRERSKPIIKPLHGPGGDTNMQLFVDELTARDAKFENISIIGGVQDLQLFNVEIYDSLIENTTIGIETPNVGFFTTLQTGNPSGTGYNVCFYGITVGEFACWDATKGSWVVSGTLNVSQQSTLGNLGIDMNTLTSVNTNGDINIDPNGFGTIRMEGPVSQHSSIGDFLVDLDNGLLNMNASSSVTLNSEQGSGTFSANDGLNLTTLNGDITLRTEIAATQNITSISNTGGLLRIITASNHNLNVGDTITLANTNSNPLTNGNYTVGSVLTNTSFLISGNVITNGTTGNLYKQLSNSINLDASVNVKIPEDVELTFGRTCNSISGNTQALTVLSCGDLVLDVSSSKNIYIKNADTRLQFTTQGTNYITYDSGNLELDITTNQLHVTATRFNNEVTNVYYSDPILTLGGLGPLVLDDNKDRGIEFYYHTGSFSRLGWFGMKNDSGRFTFIPNATNTNEVITGLMGDFEYNNLFVTTITLNSGGQVNLGCGDLVNVENIMGCSGDLTIWGSENVTIVADNSINLSSGTNINIPNNIPLQFGTCGSNILENTTSNLVLTGCKNIHLRTTSNGVVSIPTNSLLTFTGSTQGSQSIYGDTSGNLRLLSSKDLFLTTTGGSVIIPDDTKLSLGYSTTEFLVANTNSGISLSSSSLLSLNSRNTIRIQSTTGDIVLNVLDSTNNVRLPTDVDLTFGLSGSDNSISSSSSGSLYILGSTSSTMSNIVIDNTSSINLYSSSTVKLHEGTRLLLEDSSSSYIVSNNDVFEMIQSGTSGVLVLSSNVLQLNSTGGNLRIMNSTTSITSGNLLARIPNTQFTNVTSFIIDGVTTGSTTLISTENTRFRDPILTLSYVNSHTLDDNKDRGIEYNYYDSRERLGWFGWKNTTGRFTFYSDAVNTNEVISGTLGAFELGNVFINETIQFVSVGEIDMNCGKILNVREIVGCSGDLSIKASNNTTLSTGTLSLLANTSIDISSGVPLTFGGSNVNIVSNTSGTLTLNANGKVIVNANLQVLGTTTTIESTVGSLVDPVFTLGGVGPLLVDDNKDRGIAFHYHTGIESKLGFFGFDDSDYKFKYLVEATNANEVLTGIYGDIVINDVCAENITLNVNSTSGGVIQGLTQLSGGVISLLTTSGNLNLTPTQGGSVIIPYNRTFGIGDTSTGFYSDTSGNVRFSSRSLDISTTESITLNSDDSIVIPQNIPLYFGTNETVYLIRDTLNNLEFFNSGGNILLTPSQTINSSTGHIVIPANNPITFCNYENRILSDCDQLYLYGFNGVSVTTPVTTINGDLNVIGTISASSQNIDVNAFILPLGTNQVLAITSIVNGPSANQVDITTNAGHNLQVGDTVILSNTDSVPTTDGTFIVSSVVDSDTIRVIATTLTTSGTTGSLKSNLVTNPGKDVGIQVNWHTGVTTGTAEGRFGFFGFKRSTERWTFIDRGTNMSDVFSGTLGSIEFSKGHATAMSGFRLEGTLQGGAQLITGSNFDVGGGEIDNTPIGVTIASTGRFTTLTSTIQTNVEDITINSNLNYSLERYTVSSSFPLRNPLTNVVLSFINVSGVTFTSTGNTMADGSVDGQVKKLLIESMGNDCEYQLNFTAGRLVAPNPLNQMSDPTLIKFKRQGQSLELIWSSVLSAWIVSNNGAYIT